MPDFATLVPNVAAEEHVPRKRHSIADSLLVLAAIGLALLLVASGALRWREHAIDDRVLIHHPAIERYAREQGLPVELVRSVVRAESGGDPRAVSRTGARGLMQLMPDAETDALKRLRIARGDLFDPDYNIRVGTAYLRIMLDRFGGDVYLAVAAYNAGPTRIADAWRANRDLPSRQIARQFAPAETVAYCEKVIQDRWDRLDLPRAQSPSRQ